MYWSNGSPSTENSTDNTEELRSISEVVAAIGEWSAYILSYIFSPTVTDSANPSDPSDPTDPADNSIVGSSVRWLSFASPTSVSEWCVFLSWVISIVYYVLLASHTRKPPESVNLSPGQQYRFGEDKWWDAFRSMVSYENYN